MIRFILTIFFCGLIAPYPQASVMFKFIKNPEFVKSGARILFREGRTKGIGQVTQVNLGKYLTIRKKTLRNFLAIEVLRRCFHLNTVQTDKPKIYPKRHPNI